MNTRNVQNNKEKIGKVLKRGQDQRDWRLMETTN